MKLLHVIFTFFIIASTFMIGCDANNRKSLSEEEKISQKVEALMELMTLDEKIGQLNMPGAGDITTGLATNTGIVPKIRKGKVGTLLNISGVEKIHETQRIAVEESRLGIPLIFAMDVIHGYKTLFPVPLGLASSWDLGLIEQTARIASQEATAEGISVTLSPVADLSRDPRWGRIVEGPGEDPFLGAEITAAMIRGYQGQDLSAHNTMMGCLKHFALYGAPEAGRDYNTVDMSRLRMYNVYFPPYKAAIDAGVGSVMASFNDVDNVPATGNKWLFTEVLRNQWGFDGFVMTDYTGIDEISVHGLGDIPDVAALALDAGIDMDMVGESYLETLKTSVEEGKISKTLIDQACRRVLTAKFKLGLFEDPYRYGSEKRAEAEVFTKENRVFARRAAAASMVLLKNQNNVLPLEKTGTIGVIGPLANNRENMAGTWSVAGDFKQCVSLVDGLKNAVGDQARILYAKGSNVYRDPELEARVSIFGKPTYRDERSESVLIREALTIARKSDVVIAAIGEAAEMSGECSSRSDIGIPDTQLNLLKTLIGTGKPVVVVLFTGRPLAMPWTAEHVPAILNAWFGGTEAGNAMADILFGNVNPSAKLPVTFPRTLGQVPIYYSAKSTGRPITTEWFQKFKTNYLDVPNEPLYPFGYGLSYSNFEYSDISFSKPEASGQDTIIANVKITNTSNLDGHEVVQLYVHDIVASNTRPEKELKGFQKVMIPAGQTVDVSFDITTEMFRFYKYDPETNFEKIIHTWEPGEFEIMIGGSSTSVKSGTLTWSR